ncbi:sorting nexin-11 [Aulostomus maculatus]
MISNQEDEFVAVRVQDPRVQNEGSWNSYVDYKIFLHTNSKAFTAKTSCVRRRYSEFVWLKKKMQKNAGLVPVPDLPGKSFFSFSSEDFLERRRQGLQAFLDQVVHMTVCLSDSQLHLFLQTQLPVGHIQDCVQGHTPYSVTDAILTYASSNRGLAQAQEDDPMKEPSLTVSYESMESPAPHQPQTRPTNTTPEPASHGEDLLECCDLDSDGLQHKDKSCVRVLQRNHLLEAVVEKRGPVEPIFFLGDRPDDPAEDSQQKSCQILTPVEVHSPMVAGVDKEGGTVEKVTILDTIREMASHPGVTDEEGQRDDSASKPGNSEGISGFTNHDSRELSVDLEDICCQNQVSLDRVTSELDGPDPTSGTAGPIPDVPCPEEQSGGRGQENSDKLVNEEETTLQGNHLVPEGTHDDVEQQPSLAVSDNEKPDDGDDQSLPSSNESIVKVSDEESLDEADVATDYMTTEVAPHWSDMEEKVILDLQENGCPAQKDRRYLADLADLRDLSSSLDLSVGTGDLTENSDFSVLETGSEVADSKFVEQEAPPSPSMDAKEETRDVEVH